MKTQHRGTAQQGLASGIGKLAARRLAVIVLAALALFAFAAAARAQQAHWFFDRFAAYDQDAYDAVTPPPGYGYPLPGFFRHPWQPAPRRGYYAPRYREYDDDDYPYARRKQRVIRDRDADRKARIRRLRNDRRFIAVPKPRAKPAMAAPLIPPQPAAKPQVAALGEPAGAPPVETAAPEKATPALPGPDRTTAIEPLARPAPGTGWRATPKSPAANRAPARKTAPASKQAAVRNPAPALGGPVVVDGIPKTAHGTYVPSSGRLMSCDKAAGIVRDFGFSEVTASECVGNVYSFEARRDGDRFKIKLSALNGELTEIRRQ